MKKKLWKDEEKRDSVYRDLAPINSIKPEEESIRALRWAIKNPNVHNIALSGPYGSGKSSVIQSYLAYYDISNIYKIFECIIPSKLSGILKIFPKSSKKNLRISLATFDESDENNIEKDELQRGILKQLFYKVDASRIPLSRYRKLHHIKWYRYVIAVILIILLIVSGIYLKSPEDTCNFFIHYLEGLSKKEIIMRGGIALFLVGGISYLLWVCTSRFRIKSITVGDVTAEGKGTEEESILDQNIDEILYFFEKTKYKVVFVEDLDRFNDTEIFVKLRELNEILNGYEVLNKRGKITFVYAVRDDLFKKEAERTKFFDFIIPVIPVINSTNSDDKYKKLEMNSIEEAKKELQETDRKIQELRANTLQQLLLNKEFEEELPEEVKNNSLLMVLLRNGYINENYADYINYFREGAISRSELNFIRTVRNNQGECQFDYVIYHHANVIEKLFDYEFDQTELLNYSLMDYMLQNCIESPQMKILIKQVTNRSRKSREFINCYLVREQNIPKFVKQITATSKHIWEDIVGDVLLTEDNKTYYLNVILSYAAIECIKENDFVLPDTEEGAIAQYICSKPDIFERLEDVKPDKWVQIIENLGVDFYKVNLQRTDKKILEVIIDNWLYQLNDYMIKEIVQILKPEYLPQLFVKNYFCLRMLQQRQILDYIDEYINEYVETIIIGEETNTEECREDVERIIEALLNKNQDSYSLCEKVLKKEHLAHWDTFAEFLPQRKEAKDLWKYLLIYNRITASWENCIAYYEAFEMIDDILCSYIDNNIEQICINQERNRDENDEPFKMSYQFLKELLVSHIGYDTFEKIISKYRIQSFDYQCNEFEEDRLYLMVQKKYIPFSADILKELKEMSQQLWLNYIKNYKEKFLDDLAVSEIDLDDVKSLIRSDIFSGKEVKNILEEIDVTKIDVELSKMLLAFSEEVIFEKTYVEAVWEELPEENRYRWLYNQMDAYNLDELAEHFAQLEATYHQFAQRTQHKYKVHNNEFNMQLCEKLKRRGFLTSVNYKGKWIEGYVKKAV